MERLQIAIVGSGFAGSILARALHRQGHRVTLLDRRRHPRFALGESSTPLAALSLERLARRYGLDDLHHLAAYGRWCRHLPQLRRGLKRGFTFYWHRPGEPFANSAANDRRLLVAASPDDAVADAHWLREDVDCHLARRAAAEGVTCLEEAEVTELERHRGAWRLSGTWQGRPLRLAADLLVDAAGAGGFLARHLAIPPAAGGLTPRTSLVFGHFAGAATFTGAAAAAGADLPPGPYPDEQAAVHHLLHEGWMYVLPFDHGVVSAGFVLAATPARNLLARLPPQRVWDEILGRYPTLEAQFGGAAQVRPPASVALLQHRMERAAGADWALLPHAFCFFSPMFSTGIAWSLLAAERLALLVGGAPDRQALARGLERYGLLLRLEADHLDRMIAGAYLAAARDFDLFAAWCDLYFVAASFAELRQRLCPEGGAAWAWQGFLGCADRLLSSSVERTLDDLRALPAGPIPRELRRHFAATVRRRVARRNLIGMADPARNHLYGVEIDQLLRHPRRLGLSAGELRERLHRLRGDAVAGGDAAVDRGRPLAHGDRANG
jgi:FADH2 O2-dependent halogenase